LATVPQPETTKKVLSDMRGSVDVADAVLLGCSHA